MREDLIDIFLRLRQLRGANADEDYDKLTILADLARALDARAEMDAAFRRLATVARGETT